MFFAHWSSKDSSYRDMERRQLDCERCNENTHGQTLQNMPEFSKIIIYNYYSK